MSAFNSVIFWAGDTWEKAVEASRLLLCVNQDSPHNTSSHNNVPRKETPSSLLPELPQVPQLPHPHARLAAIGTQAAYEDLTQLFRLDPEFFSTLAEDPRKPFLLVQTSGSASGKGKWVMLSHRALMASAQASAHMIGNTYAWATNLPTTHIGGFNALYRSLAVGHVPLFATYHDFLAREDDFFAQVEHPQAQHPQAQRPNTQRKSSPFPYNMALVPTQLVRLLDELATVSDETIARFRSRVATILVGGAKLPSHTRVQAQKYHLTIVESYGMSESAGGCVYDGQPFEGLAIDIQENAGRQVVLSGPMIAEGYLVYDGSRVRLDKFHGKFPSHDAGILHRGESLPHLEIIGRIDNAFTSGGVTIYPEQIEKIATEFLGECYLVSRPHPTWGSEAILVSAKEASPTDQRRINALITTHYGREMKPHHWLSLSSLGQASFPLRPSGKVDRRTLGEYAARALG